MYMHETWGNIYVKNKLFILNQNKKYSNFERNKIRATVFLKWTDFKAKLF